MRLGKKTARESEQDAGLHVVNDAGDLTPQQTSEQQQQGNANLDNQKEGAQVMADQTVDQQSQQQIDQAQTQKQPQQDQQPQQPAQDVPPSPTADDMKGTTADPVSYSNPAFDPSMDAAKVGLKGDDLNKDSSEIDHKLKPTNFYKKGDKITFAGVEFEAIYDGHADLPPNMWKAVA